jgi:hypothetical protein
LSFLGFALGVPRMGANGRAREVKKMKPAKEGIHFGSTGERANSMLQPTESVTGGRKAMRALGPSRVISAA